LVISHRSFEIRGGRILMRAVAVREDIRDLILDAADRLLARYGYKKMTIDDLAREVGVGKGTIYLHFSSKEEVALSRIDRVIEHLKAELKRLARTDEAPSSRLRRMLLLRVIYRFDSVQHYTESINHVMAAIRPALLERRKRYFEDEARIMAEVLKEGRRAGDFFFKDALATARALLTATNSLLPYSLSPKELGERDSLEEQTARIVDLLLSGLRRR
jgi:AcrR family transcriptional regulator